MARRRRNRRSRIPRVLRSRYVWIPAVIIVVVTLAILLVPRRAVQIVSVDREHGWRISAAPPRRKIVWRPAEPVETPAGDATARDSLIRPQLADYGSTLYFTIRSPDRGADIYRSQLKDGQWQPAEPIASLNTEADDIGPIIQPGNRQLYFYSNRPGGYGGFDIYTSKRAADGSWSKPVNAGPHVNSPAHEYDPAVTADGRQLFFSSNRTQQMARQMAEDELGEPGDRWDSTLRADFGLPTFDLYVARRESADEDWSAAKPLAGVNRPETNEGSPYISPSGVFLYFASDRKQRRGEPTNFDLYRARLDGNRQGPPQNLGRGVNTEANEIEPALSDEGFRLVFSRNEPSQEADGPGRQYRIYSSLATEVEEEVFWDTAHLVTLLEIIKRMWWWVILAILLAALLAALVWYLREVTLRRLPLPAFVLIAIFLHMLLGVTSFFIYFGGDIVARLKKDLEEVAVIAHLSSRDMHQSHEPGPEAYEKVADLEHVETVTPTEIDRQVVETPNVPITPQVEAPNVPAKLTRELDRQRPDATLPKAEVVVSGGPDLARRQRSAAEAILEEIEVEQTKADQSQEERTPLDVEVAIRRRRPLPDMADAPRISRRTLDPVMELPKEQIDAERATETPIETQPDQQTVDLERAARATERPEATETVRTEDVKAPLQDPAEASQPERMVVEVDRQQPVPQTDTPKMDRRRISADAALRLTQADTSVERIAEQPVETKTDQEPTDLSRMAHAAAEPAASPEVTTQELAAPAPSAAPDSQLQGVAVRMERQVAEAPQSDAPQLPSRRLASDAAMRLTDADTSVEPLTRDAADASPAGRAVADAALERSAAEASRDQATPADTGSVATEQLLSPRTTPAPESSPQAVPVDVSRIASSDAAGGAETAPQLLDPRAIAAQPGMRLTASDTAAVPTADTAPGGGAEAAGEQLALARIAAVGSSPAPSPEVSTEALGQPAASPAGSAGPTTAQVAVGRLAPAAPGAPVGTTAGVGVPVGETAMRLGASGVGADRQVAQASYETPNGPVADVRLAAQRGGSPSDGAAAESGPIQTASIELPAIDGSGEPSLPRGVGVNIGRRSDASAPAASTGAPAPLALPDRPIALAGGRGDLTREATASLPAIPATGSVAADLAKAARTSMLGTGDATEQVATEAPLAAGGGTATTTAPKGLGVTVARTGDAASPSVAPAAKGVEVALIDRRVGLGGSDETSAKLAEIVSGTGPKSAEVKANLTRAGQGRALSPSGVAQIETVTTEGPAVATGGDGKTSSPRGVGVEVTRRGIVGPAPQGGAVRVTAVSPNQMGLSGLGELAQAVAGSATTPTPRSGSIAAEISRARGPRDLTGIAEIEVEAADAGGLAATGDAQMDATGRRGIDVEVTRRGPASEGVAAGTLQLAMAGSLQGSPRLSGQTDDTAPALDVAVPSSARAMGQLARARRGATASDAAIADVAAETIGRDSETGDGTGNTPPSIAGVSVGLERASGPMFELPFETEGRVGGMHNPDNRRLVVGSLDSEAIDVPPSFSPITSRIARRTARAPSTLYAEDSIGLATMMRLRQVNEEEKRDLVEAFGGDEDTLTAVRSGLAWIVKQQHPDGRWRLDKFADNKSKGHGDAKSDTAATALALLPLLGDGNTQHNGDYRDEVRKGIKWLVDNQKDDGDLYTGGSHNAHMYSHGMASIALCEAYGMSRDPELREPAQRAVDFIVAAQHKEGGWRYTPGQAGDTSVLGWQVMALKSAQMAELDVPPETLAKAKQWLQRVQQSRGEFKYQRSGHGSPAMTAEGLLCHQYLGASRSDPRLHAGAEFLLKHMPRDRTSDTSYGWYYGTQVMYHMQGQFWQQWNDAMKETLLRTQHQSGDHTGSWDPKDKYEKNGGRLYSTALRVLMLEVYYRHLPLYQVLEQ